MGVSNLAFCYGVICVISSIDSSSIHKHSLQNWDVKYSTFIRKTHEWISSGFGLIGSKPQWTAAIKPYYFPICTTPVGSPTICHPIQDSQSHLSCSVRYPRCANTVRQILRDLLLFGIVSVIFHMFLLPHSRPSTGHWGALQTACQWNQLVSLAALLLSYASWWAVLQPGRLYGSLPRNKPN